MPALRHSGSLEDLEKATALLDNMSVRNEYNKEKRTSGKALQQAILTKAAAQPKTSNSLLKADVSIFAGRVAPPRGLSAKQPTQRELNGVSVLTLPPARHIKTKEKPKGAVVAASSPEVALKISDGLDQSQTLQGQVKISRPIMEPTAKPISNSEDSLSDTTRHMQDRARAAAHYTDNVYRPTPSSKDTVLATIKAARDTLRRKQFQAELADAEKYIVPSALNPGLPYGRSKLEEWRSLTPLQQLAMMKARASKVGRAAEETRKLDEQQAYDLAMAERYIKLSEGDGRSKLQVWMQMSATAQQALRDRALEGIADFGPTIRKDRAKSAKDVEEAEKKKMGKLVRSAAESEERVMEGIEEAQRAIGTKMKTKRGDDWEKMENPALEEDWVEVERA